MGLGYRCAQKTNCRSESPQKEVNIRSSAENTAPSSAHASAGHTTLRFALSTTHQYIIILIIMITVSLLIFINLLVLKFIRLTRAHDS